MSALDVLGETVGHGGHHHHGGGGWGYPAGVPWPWYPPVYAEIPVVDEDYGLDANDIVRGEDGEELDDVAARVLLGALALTHEADKAADDAYLAAVRKVNAVKPVTYEAARALVKVGLDTISEALTLFSRQKAQSTFVPNTDARTRDVKGHLDWHLAKIEAGAATPRAIYGGGDDLKKYVILAFAEYNVGADGLHLLEQKLDFYNILGQELGRVITVVAESAGKVAKAAAWSIPWWVWVVAAGAVGSVVLVSLAPTIGAAIAGARARKALAA